MPDRGTALAAGTGPRFNVPMIRAIIFDFDGVIADTEPLHYEAFARVLDGRVVMPTREVYFAQYLGLNDAAFVRTLHGEQEVALRDGDLEALLERKNAAYEAVIARGLRLLPGVAEFIDRVRPRLPLAICSGARRVEIESILRSANRLDAFLAIVSADDVPASKPDPAGFRMAAERLRPTAAGLAPGECLAIEDSAHGITAARAAGMKVVRVRTYATGSQCPSVDLEVDSLRELTDAQLTKLGAA